jgi:hypothetical protein
VSGSQQTIQNKQGQVQGTKQGPSQGPAQGAKQGPAQGAKQGPAAAPKKNDPFAKDSKGNYLDTSGAGSRARFGASIGSKLTAPFRAVAEYNPASLALKAALAGSDPRAKAAQQKAKAADDAAVMKKNAERVARLRSAGREMDARFYEKNPRALKDGGVGKYAAGGAGKVRKGQMKGK